MLSHKLFHHWRMALVLFGLAPSFNSYYKWLKFNKVQCTVALSSSPSSLYGRRLLVHIIEKRNGVFSYTFYECNIIIIIFPHRFVCSTSYCNIYWLHWLCRTNHDNIENYNIINAKEWKPLHCEYKYSECRWRRRCRYGTNFNFKRNNFTFNWEIEWKRLAKKQRTINGIMS